MTKKEDKIEMPNGMTVRFAPGCFDGFEGSQEELDEFVKEITEMFQNADMDELMDNGTVVDLGDIEQLENNPEIAEALEHLININENQRNLH